MSRAVIILGMHRSGTSCLTGSLQEAGLKLGEVSEKNLCNEKGTRENVSIMELNDAVLASVGAAWDKPPEDEITWREDHKVWRKHLIKAVAQGPRWGFKDPRTLFTVKGWREALPNAHLIATFRDPYAVAQSLNKRNGFPVERGLALWRAYNERLLAVCDENEVDVINFDWSPTRYKHGLETICAAAGLETPANGFKFFETRLRKNQSSSHLDLPPELRSIHRRLQTAARITMHRLRGVSRQAVSPPNIDDEKAEGDRRRPVTSKNRSNALSPVQKDKSEKRGVNADGAASRIAALESAIKKDGARPALLDQLGDLLAQESRWPQADDAYRRAQQARCALLGFRCANQTEPPTDPAAARSRLTDMCKMAARSGAQYWAENLNRLLCSVDGDAPAAFASISWPRGESLPQREYVPIRPQAEGSREKKLSVMIPVYGIEREDWFRETIDGVLEQNLDPDNTEIVVVDDASDSDSAQKIAESYDVRVRYVRNENNLGLVGNHNRCIAEAAGEFVHILHQDDRVQPGFYDALLPVLSENAQLAAAVCNTAYINADGDVTSKTPPPAPRGILEHWRITLSLLLRIQFPSIIVRRRAYEAVGGFSPSLKFSFDWDMWNRIAASGPVWFEPGHLAQYRVHEGSATYGFGWLERVQDAMQTVSHMVRLLPAAQRRSTAEMAMHKFFHRYWMLLSAVAPADTSSDQQSLIDFLLSGWTAPSEKSDLDALFSELRSIVLR